jgi:hypothetical protein
VIGTEGVLYWDYEAAQVVLFGPDGRPAAAQSQPDRWTPNHMYLDELRHFLECVERKTDTVNSVEGGLASLELAFVIRSYGEVGDRHEDCGLDPGSHELVPLAG